MTYATYLHNGEVLATSRTANDRCGFVQRRGDNVVLHGKDPEGNLIEQTYYIKRVTGSRSVHRYRRHVTIHLDSSMPIKVEYEGGPRNGNKGNIRDLDSPPEYIKAIADARAANMQPGSYKHIGRTATSGEHEVYVWEPYRP